MAARQGEGLSESLLNRSWWGGSTSYVEREEREREEKRVKERREKGKREKGVEKEC
jgi:hypothetical protein